MTGSHQEEHYEQAYDYRSESPHLKHRKLYETLMERTSDAIFGGVPAGTTPEVLEIGAGDGAVSERLLSLGCSVTATEMSQHSVEAMLSRFGTNDRFRALHDATGDLQVLGDRRYDAIVFASVLHHIPDYLSSISGAVTGHLKPGGSLISVQDPLWYARQPGASLRLTRAAYLTWRLGQGNWMRGIRTRVRRRFSGLSEDAPGDAVEYHVVRDGVDEDAISQLLEPSFSSVRVFSYWSSQGTLAQKLGERLDHRNTFAVFASGYRADPGAADKDET